MEPEVLRSFTFSTSPFSWKRAIASSVGTVKRRIGILAVDDLLHAAADDVHILIHNRATQTDIHIESVGYRNINDHIRIRINILHRLAEHKEKRPGIGTRT